MATNTPMWETDAETLEASAIESMLFVNTAVRTFLDHPNKRFVVASKGIGKTLLLKAKRFRLEDRKTSHRRQSQRIVFVPEDRPYLDRIEFLGYLDDKHKQFLAEWTNAKRAWELAIQLSALSYYAHRHPGEHADSIRDHLKEALQVPDRDDTALDPSYVFQILCKSPIITMQQYIGDFHYRCSHWFRALHTPISIFIDRLDQALLEYDDPALWTSVQVGLLEAAWDVTRTNAHVKVYTSIRQEAYAHYHSSNKEAITGSLCHLKYTRTELHQLLNTLVRFYEDRPTWEAFVERDWVVNSTAQEEEEVFDYIYRHTVGRPRDFVTICSLLHHASRPIREEEFKSSVNTASCSEVVKNVFDENMVFLATLRTLEEQERLLSMLSWNVLSTSEAKTACRAFNGISECPCPTCKLCDCHHPFCEMYNVGLLGVVKEDAVQGGTRQDFLDPYRMNQFAHGILPEENGVLFLHPALNELAFSADQKIGGGGFHLMKFVTVGAGCRWEPVHELTVLLQKLSLKHGDKTVIEKAERLAEMLRHENNRGLTSRTKALLGVVEQSDMAAADKRMLVKVGRDFKTELERYRRSQGRRIRE